MPAAASESLERAVDDNKSRLRDTGVLLCEVCDPVGCVGVVRVCR